MPANLAARAKPRFSGDSAVQWASLLGWMEGDGGLTVFTTRCSTRVVKGLVELLQLNFAERIEKRLAAVRARAARELLIHGRHVVVVSS